MDNGKIAADFVDHFERAFLLLKELVEAFPEQHWLAGQDARNIPARWAYHSVNATDFYSGDDPEAFDRSKRISWESPKEDLPSKTELLAYANDVLERIRARWVNRADAEMLEPTAYEWTGSTRMAQLLYSLRHFMYHLGEFANLSRAEGLPESPWE